MTDDELALADNDVGPGRSAALGLTAPGVEPLEPKPPPKW
jgi:hypothetical protein